MFCPECGAFVKDGTQFCTHCGAAVEAHSDQPILIPQEPDLIPPPVAETDACTDNQTIDPMVQTFSHQKQAPEQKQSANVPKKNSSRVSLIVALLASGIIIITAVSIILLLVFRCAVFGHSWIDATCTTPKICSVCNEKEGAPNGHTWRIATCTEPKQCTVCATIEGEPLSHQWIDATCTAPRTCSICSITEGGVAGHVLLDATCSQPRRCSVCNYSEGTPIGHNWTPATFAKPKTCVLCGEVQGTAIEYKNISVEAEINAIREIYNTITAGINTGIYRQVMPRNGVNVYYNAHNSIVAVIVYRGTEGIGSQSNAYSRSYYFADGKLVFAFFEGSDSHRLYFYNEMLMRWRHSGAGTATVNHDFTFTEDYFYWEELALKEAASFN